MKIPLELPPRLKKQWLIGPAKNDDYKAVLHNAQAFHNEFQSIIYANSAVTRKVPVKA